MSGSQLVLFAPTPDFRQDIAAHLPQQLGQPLLLPSLDAVHRCLDPQRVGVVVCAVASAGEANEAVALVRELRLRDWVQEVVLVEAAEVAASGLLACLDPYTAGRLRWPEQAPLLAGLLLATPSRVP